MAKTNRSHFPQSGRCDVIEGILMGNGQTNALNKRYQDDLKPDFMIGKLRMIAEQSSCAELKQQAGRAAQLLEKFPGHIPVNESERSRILKEVCSENNVLAPSPA